VGPGEACIVRGRKISTYAIGHGGRCPSYVCGEARSPSASNQYGIKRSPGPPNSGLGQRGFSLRVYLILGEGCPAGCISRSSNITTYHVSGAALSQVAHQCLGDKNADTSTLFLENINLYVLVCTTYAHTFARPT